MFSNALKWTFSGVSDTLASAFKNLPWPPNVLFWVFWKKILICGLRDCLRAEASEKSYFRKVQLGLEIGASSDVRRTCEGQAIHTDAVSHTF